MNFKEIKSAVEHLKKTCKCMQCQSKYELEDISVIASTQSEALFELICNQCQCSTIVSVLLSLDPDQEVEIRKAEPQRKHKNISQDDVLDIKNFLSTFDGNFKKIFSKKK